MNKFWNASTLLIFFSNSIDFLYSTYGVNKNEEGIKFNLFQENNLIYFN